MKSNLSQELILPCGAKLKNRIAKAAMSENMARGHLPGVEFVNVYDKWAKGGAGLLITGNVMCDSRALGEPQNVVVEKSLDLYGMNLLNNWAQAGTQNETHLWMQINHPGRQSPKFLSKAPVAPSAIPLRKPLDRMFNSPRALDSAEIIDIVKRFGDTAEIAKKTGFTGVQIHGAHGYLISQFLSPLSNQRNDDWGGALKNRSRFVLEVFREIRSRVGGSFPIGIKLNSADFQKGGMSEDESMQVVSWLEADGIDLIEISGGSYEVPVMVEGNKKDSTRQREAYFLEFARKLKTELKVPLMVTGGFRTKVAMENALSSGELDLVGLARSLALNPNFPQELLSDENKVSLVHPLTSGFNWLDRIVPLEIVWYTTQIHRMGKGKLPNPEMSVYRAILKSLAEVGAMSLKRNRA